MTAKEVGLWEPWGAVDAEDVRHMMSRLHIFTCRAKVTKLKDVCLCGMCCCRWIVAGAAEYDAQQLREQMPQPGPLPPPQDGSDQIGQKVVGMAALIGKAAIPGAIASMIETEVHSLGAVHVKELTPADWEGLASWQQLRPLQQRRFLAVAGGFE